MTDISKVIHLYLGCQCIRIDDDGIERKFWLNAYNLNYYRSCLSELKPILRKLDSMTPKEIVEYEKTMELRPATSSLAIMVNHETPETFLYLLSKGFWLFGDQAFEDGSIINKPL